MNGVLTNLHEKGFDELKAMAEENRPEVLKELGDRYMSGMGCERSEQQAEKYYILAMQMGSADACLALGLMYEKLDKEKADKYFYAGFRKGNMVCTYRFARSLIETNEDEAVELLTFGAVNGGVECALCLQQFYADRGEQTQSEYFAKLVTEYMNRPVQKKNAHKKEKRL